MSARRTWMLRALVLALLGLVFWAYLDPHTVRDLSERVWSCVG